QGRPVLELHAQSQTACSQHFLDFVERLATQVGGLEQLVLGALNEVADVVDVFGLEAVGRTHREFEIVDRTQQHRIDLRLDAAGGLVRFVGAFERSKYRQLIHEDAGCLAHGLFGRNHTVGLDIEHKLVEVGTLFDTRAFNGVADAAHRAVRSVEHDAANGVGAIVGQCTHVAGHITTTLLDLDLHFQLAGFGQRGDDVIGINDLDVVRQVDVGGGDDTGALTTQGQRDFLAVVKLEYDALQVQQNVDDVFTHARQSGVFVHHAGDLHFGGGVACHGRQQNAAQGIAQCVAITAFERFHDDFRVILAHRFNFDGPRLQKTLRHLRSFINTLRSLHP